MHLIFDDARKVVENFENGSLNVVISDLTEPFEMGLHFPAFSLSSLPQVVYDKLDDQGVYVVQSSILRPLIYTMHAAIRRTLQAVSLW